MNTEVIKFPENIHNDKFDIDIRPYLTIQEIDNIAQLMLQHDDYLGREIARDTALLQYCVVGEDFEGMSYDELKACGLIDLLHSILHGCRPNTMSYDGYDYLLEIDFCVERAESVQLQLKNFLKEASKYIKKSASQLDNKKIDKLIEQYEKVTKNGHHE